MLRRNDIVDRLAQKGYTKKDSGVILDDVFNVIMEALAEGESVSVFGFGTFGIRESSEREIVDYQTKEKVVLPAYKTPKFTAGKLLKRAVKEGYVRTE